MPVIRKADVMWRKQKSKSENGERWLLTYSDLMNLLLILFIILYVSSDVNTAKYEAVSNSLHVGFSTISTNRAVLSFSGGGGGNGNNGDNGDATDTGIPPYWNQPTDETEDPIDTEYEDFYSSLQDLLDESDLDGDVTVSLDNTGIVISFSNNVLFNSGSAEISESSRKTVMTIGNLLAELPCTFILIEGHTDNLPISTSEYIDNMDLSTQRAANVWRLLVSCGLSPEKMASIGYGEYRPVASNDTAENRAKNRRVVISILKQDLPSDTEIYASDDN